MDAHVPRSFGSALLLGGAFAIGWVLHQVFVLETMALTAPVSVFVGLAGLGLVALGRRLERAFDPSMFVPESPDDEDAYDESLSPLDEDALDGRERDDSYDG